jgi:hypothetical protein
MKKVYSSLLIAFASITFFQTANAQLALPGTGVPQAVAGSRTSAPYFNQAVVDTMFPPVFMDTCFTNNLTPYTYYNWVSPAIGYVTGNSKLYPSAGADYVGLELAQRYSFTGNAMITDVLVEYGLVVGSDGNTSAKIYTKNAATKLPKTQLGISDTLSTLILTTNTLTDYTFTPAITVTSDFFASIVLPDSTPTGDTVVIFSTLLNCHSSDSISSVRYQVGSGSGWIAFTSFLEHDAVRDTGLEMAIYPVLNVVSGVNDPPSSRGLSLLGVYPNPASTVTTVSYRVDKPTVATINVFDLSGKVYQNYTESVSTGTHQFPLNLKDMAAGNYFYTIKTTEARMTSKFSVIK